MTETAGADTLVIAFAGAGAFSPPMAFYVACVTAARATLGVGQVVLAFTDRANPCVTAVEMDLRARGIAVRCQRVAGGLWPDAVHFVASGPVVPSPNWRTVFSFRGFALRPDDGHDVALRLFFGSDTVPGYPRAADWDGSVAQLAAALAYAEADITLHEIPASLATTGGADFTADVGVLADLAGPARLAMAYAALYPDDRLLPVLRPLLAAMLDPTAPMPDLHAVDPADAVIVDNIVLTRAIRRGTQPRRAIAIGPEADFLAKSCNPAKWSLLWRINLLAMRLIRPTRKIAAMVTMRDDGINILEWVAHYQAIGVEGIFIYTNDNIDGSSALLARLAARGLIMLISQTSGFGTYIQRKSLQHAVHVLPELRDFEWVLFVDSDELTIPAAHFDHTIKNLIARTEMVPRAGAVILPWHWRLWSHRFDREPGMCLARFAHAEPHALYKPLVRLYDALGMCAVHAPELDADRIIVSSDFTEVGPDQRWDDQLKSHQGGWIEHYWGRSFVEFVIKKQRADSLHLPSEEFNRAYSLFETWNRPMTLQNLHPVASVVIARTRAMMERMLHAADIAEAVAGIEARFAARAAAIAADPALRATFDGMVDPNNRLHWTAENVADTVAVLHQPNGVSRLAEAMSRRFPDGPDRGSIHALLAAILDPSAPLPVPETSNPQAALWLATIAASRLDGVESAVQHLGPEYDFIAASRAPPSWGLFQWLGVLALRAVRPRDCVAAMVSVRNEGVNLLEWIAHCQAIGVERIFVYTNGNDDGSDGLLTALAEAGIITLVLQTCAPGVWAQSRAQHHALLMVPELHRYRWVLFLDADEFLIPDARFDHRIAPLLAAVDSLLPQPGAVLLPWRMRLWPHHYDRPAGMALAAYQHGRAHEGFKSIVRPGAATSMEKIHFPDLDPGVPMVDSALHPLPLDGLWSDIPKSDAGGRIEHVWTRSFTDFVIKRRRGFTAGLRPFEEFVDFNRAMTPDTLRPIEPLVIARTRARLDALLAIPEIAAAAATVADIYAGHAAEIASDTALRAIFDALPDPTGVPAT